MVTPIYWVACLDYVYPVTALYPMGKCGKCGERPDIRMPEQERARRLTPEEVLEHREWRRGQTDR